jgi:hypothetical protein
MSGNLVDSWESKLKALFDEIDDEIETRFGSLYNLHPSRAKKGSTSNKEQDGLFDIGASFSPGFGSEHGRGYVLDVDMMTLDQVPREVQNHIEEIVADLIQVKLPIFFPGRELEVRRDGNVFKIIGDLTLL